MSYIKTTEEIKLVQEGGKILGGILEKLAKMAKPGVSAFEIDKEAERLVKAAGGKPSFKGYKGKKNERSFPTTICACLNEELVHGIASKNKVLKDGDIFSIDIGMEWPTKNFKFQSPIQSGTNFKSDRGYFTDTAITVAVGKIPEKTEQLLNVTRKALEIGIKQCVVGNTVADIGRAIQKYVEPQGYGVVRDLVGHGVGHAVHEEPRVPNYYDKDSEKWILQPGVVLALEPMITMGDWHIVTADDGWSVKTADNSLCAHCEHTVVITEEEPIVVTRRPGEKP